MKKIILDTNFLTIPYQFNLDIFRELELTIEEDFELITLSGVVEELEKLSKTKGEDATAAKVGLKLLKQKKIKILPSSGNVDEEIIRISDKNTIVATNDQILSQKLKDKKIKTIYLRGKDRLEMR